MPSLTARTKFRLGVRWAGFAFCMIGLWVAMWAAVHGPGDGALMEPAHDSMPVESRAAGDAAGRTSAVRGDASPSSRHRDHTAAVRLEVDAGILSGEEARAVQRRATLFGWGMLFCDLHKALPAGRFQVDYSNPVDHRTDSFGWTRDEYVFIPVPTGSGSAELQISPGLTVQVGWREAISGRWTSCKSHVIDDRSVEIRGTITDSEGSAPVLGKRERLVVEGCGTRVVADAAGSFQMHVVARPCTLWVERMHGFASESGPSQDLDPVDDRGPMVIELRAPGPLPFVSAEGLDVSAY